MRPQKKTVTFNITVSVIRKLEEYVKIFLTKKSLYVERAIRNQMVRDKELYNEQLEINEEM